MKFWGITGTNGKTTCTWIAAEFLNACEGRKCAYITTVEVYDGKDRYYTGYTTPPLKQLKEIYAKMEANGVTDCVMEVSSHAIHQHRCGDTVFSGGAFTNLSEDHLDYHKTMAEYFRVKLSFAEEIAAAAAHRPGPSDGRGDFPPYVVCVDGDNGREMLEAVGKLPLNVIPVSVKSPRFDLSELKLAGEYNKSNVLTAAALAEAAGAPHETIQSVIPTLKPRWGRLERVENANVAAEVYVDFAHTPDGLLKVLSAARGMLALGQQAHDNKIYHSPSQSVNSPLQSVNRLIGQSVNSLWVVFGAGGDRDPMKRPLMGAAAAKLADRLVVTSDNPRSEDPLKIIEAVVSGIPEADRSPEKLRTEPDRRAAIRYALENAKAGDIVIIAGKGHETTQEIAGVKYPFDDRDEVRRYASQYFRVGMS